MITVRSLHVHPVKSLQGRSVDRLELGPDGFVGDRRRALIDQGSGRLMSAKRHARLLMAASDDEGITLPDGERVGYDDPDADDRMSGWLDRPVTLTEVTPDVAVAYEMTFDPPDDSAEYYAIDTPVGSFLELAAGHLVAAATLDDCSRRHPDLDWDPRRFRPNLVVEGDVEAFGEDDWCGRTLQVGSAALTARQPTVRCAMPLRAQPGLGSQPGLYAALETTHANHLGIYLDVARPGTIAVGDEVVVA